MEIWLLVVLSEKTIKLWENETGSLLKTFKGHYCSVNALAFSLDGNMIVSDFEGETIKLLEKSTESLLKPLKVIIILWDQLPFHQMEIWLLVLLIDKSIRFMGKRDWSILKTFKGHLDYVNEVAFSPKWKIIVSAS